MITFMQQYMYVDSRNKKKRNETEKSAYQQLLEGRCCL